MATYPTRDEWLKARKTIGGSDAACILGKNPWKTNIELYLEKTEQCTPDDISDKDVVKYGTEAEKPLRRLFKLDYPVMKVHYKEWNMWFNDKYPWAHASLDGWLVDKDGRRGILEIKTTNVMSSRQKEQWNERIPDNYFCQILHYMAVTESDFAILKAQLKWEIDGEIYCQTRHYRIERADVEADIEYLMAAEKRFVLENIRKRKKPDLILPEI
ncbi:MAG: YqaJ viral recombinase family protein [Lachnospiraceae bacterium]|nr:YqaJ viral recombinase family protein [Lachnospiraceae bacterium]